MVVLKHKFKHTTSIDIKIKPSSFIQKHIFEIPSNIKSKNILLFLFFSSKKKIDNFVDIKIKEKIKISWSPDK